jgi:hypothetical protein
MKVLFGLPLRQTTGFVESLLRMAGLNWKVPDFSTLCRKQKTLNVARGAAAIITPRKNAEAVRANKYLGRAL